MKRGVAGYVAAELGADGTLKSEVSYELRGDNELLLREAFHGTAKEKWKDVANLLAISDGFRGEISSVNVSDPLATREPFKVEYTITQAKFVDWSKKPVRIPALLPQIGLPDLPRKAAEGEAAPKIELGTPLDVETQMTLKLPAGTKAVVPAVPSVGSVEAGSGESVMAVHFFVMAGHSPSKTGVNALVPGHPRLVARRTGSRGYPGQARA